MMRVVVEKRNTQQTVLSALPLGSLFKLERTGETSPFEGYLFMVVTGGYVALETGEIYSFGGREVVRRWDGELKAWEV